jgi:hypothetical protein
MEGNTMTSELDRFFGTQQKPELPPAQPTHFARYPDVQSLCDVFLEEMDWNNDAYTIQQVVAGARDFKLAIGNDPKLLLHTIKKMKLEKLNISSPRSCITLARNMTPDTDSEESRQKYVWED